MSPVTALLDAFAEISDKVVYRDIRHDDFWAGVPSCIIQALLTGPDRLKMALRKKRVHRVHDAVATSGLFEIPLERLWL